MPTLTTNPRVRFDYHILEKYEAGIVLFGHEVKAVKNSMISLKGSYVAVRNKELWLINALISPYQPKNTPEDYSSTRSRKLLMHKSEIKRLIGKIKEKGLTLAPLRVYTKQNRIKLEFGLAKGKRTIDKREKIKKREADRKIGRALRNKNGDDRYR